jgi:hypothetical protein
LKEGSLVVNSSQGGGTKTRGYWTDELSGSYLDALSHRRQSLLAVALRGTRRIPCANSRGDSPPFGLPLAYVGTSNEWESAVATAGCSAAFFKAYDEANESNVNDFLAFSTANTSSIRSCFELARGNARAVRTALTVEMWDSINTTWLELKRFGNGPTSREEFSRFLRWVQESSLRFDGSAYRTMLRNDAYWFLAPRRLHRARRQHGAYSRREIPSSPARN